MHGLVTDTRGAEIAEAAAVLPLMFMMLLGIFWFGQAFSIYGAITRAAQEGARAGAAPYCTTCTAGNSPAVNAINAAKAALVIAKLDPNQAQPPASTPVFNSCAAAAVTCNAPSSNFCVQTQIQLSDPATGASGVCGISVSFQYPFQFWLPFTSLNKQRILMTASSRMHMESQ